MKIKHFTAATLAALMCLSSSMMNVFADDTSTDDHTTNIGYTVDESYKWQAPADIVFTTNIDTEVKTGTVSVTENIIEATKTLVISIGSGEDFKLTSAEGAQRDYTVSKESEVLSAGSRVLLVPSGTYDGAQDLNFELQGVVNGNTSQKAGIYTDTLNFEAILTSNYRIEYHMDGGINDPGNPATYEKDSGDINLANPTKEGYTFDGWYLSEDYSGDAVSVIANGTEGSIDLYAKWSLTPYTISYNLEEGNNDSSNPSGYNLLQLPITLAAPTKAGYTFKGWTGSNGDTPETELTIPANTTGNLSYTANWEINSYTVTYNLNGGTAENLVTGYNATMLPFTLEFPTKTNYEFAGWYETEDFSDTAVDTISTGNIGNKTLYAKWTGKQYSITYHLDSGENNVNNPATYAFNDGDVTLFEPTKDGYSFEGWYTESELTNRVTSIVNGTTGNIDLYAKWTEANFNITLKYMDGATEDSNIMASSVDSLPTPTRTGYTFNGWYTGSENISSGTLTENDFISDSTYKWTYNSSSGEWESTGNNGIRNSVSVLKTTEFNAKTGDQLSFEWRSYAESDYDYAAWNIWDVNNSKWLSGASTWGTSYNDSRSGLTPDSGLATTKGKQSSSVYTTNTYTFTADGTYQIYWTYRKDSGGDNGTDLAYVRNVNIPGQTTITISETPVNELSDNLTLYAKWNINEYSISWILNEGMLSNQKDSYNIKTSYTLPTPTRADYVFEGWYESSDFSGAKVTFIPEGSTGNKTFYAKWYDNYSIAYVLNDGTLPSDAKTVYSSGSSYALPTPTKADYIFEGWYETEDFSGSKVTSIPKGSTGDKTYYAKWYDNYTITYVLNDGALPSDAKNVYSKGSSYTLPFPTKTGYAFKGWYATSDFSGSAVTKINAGTTGNKTFYAKWGEPTYVLKTGSAFNSLIPSSTKSVVFTDEAMPADATLIDVDADGDRGVVAWLDGTTFKVSTQKPGQDIIFNKDSNSMFYQKINIESIDFASVDTSGVEYMSQMFYGAGQNATTFNLDLSGWDTSSVMYMSQMFCSAGRNATTWSIEGLSGWNTSSVRDMSYMFREAGYKATTFNLDLSSWDTSSVTDMSYMFYYAGNKATTWSIGDISSWNTSKVTNMSNMFCMAGDNATTFNLDLSGWDTSNVTNMSSMLSRAGYDATTWSIGDISSWNTSKVTNMDSMLYGAGYSTTTFNLDLSGWNTSNVASMDSMLGGAGHSATTFNLDLSGWNTSKVTDMSGMFSGAGYSATTFSIEGISNWDTSSVTDMSGMFSGAGYSTTTFNLDLSGWNTSKVTDMSYMFGESHGNSAGYNATTFNLDISSWDTSNVTDMTCMFCYVGYNTNYKLNLSGWNVNKVTSYYDFNNGVENKITAPTWVN